MTTKETSAGTLVVHPTAHPPKFLVVKAYSGFWSIPKGHVEVHESQQDAAIRETKEEVGLDVVLLGPQTSFSYTFKNNTITKVVYLFLAKATSPVFAVDDREIIDAQWLPLEAARNQLTFSNTKIAFDDLTKDIDLLLG